MYLEGGKKEFKFLFSILAFKLKISKQPNIVVLVVFLEHQFFLRSLLFIKKAVSFPYFYLCFLTLTSF